MRARNIKPGFFANDVLAECSPMARLLFIGLWGLADREGRLEDRPKRIKGQVFPFDNCEIDDLLNELGERGFVVRYEVNGVKLLCIPNFRKHQRPHVNEAKSTLAPMAQVLATKETSTCHQGVLNDERGILNDEPSRRDDHGRENIMGTYPQPFELWWQTYPKASRSKKQSAFRIWGGVVDALERGGQSKEDAEDWLLKRLRTFSKSPLANCKYCPGPEKWLLDGRYDDEDEAWNRETTTGSGKPKTQGIAEPGEEYNPNARF